ncbi:hypothetical protein [Pelomonas sp. SE-A7]|uniref:hypothetical protein n=1 Tax=Pelomonas sp. SE-A7 TaxID=3054953 RepID=UPI00259D1051|nr:hypothetical protein [Pelomonas sp. SE-A7]MDM4765637.1 hypothetical protein [Pelomonas sp. SE-A7]
MNKTRVLIALGLAAGIGLTTLAIAGDDASIFQGADLQLGRKLLKEQRCAECHAKKFGGDGSDVYRPLEKIKTAGQLRGMVESCNTELSLGMFPEEVTAIAAVLNKDYYRFK